jgi:hypothetical protein
MLFNVLQQLSTIANGLPTMEGNTELVRQVLSKPSNATLNPGRSVFLYWYGVRHAWLRLLQPTTTYAVRGGDFPSSTHPKASRDRGITIHYQEGRKAIPLAANLRAMLVDMPGAPFNSSLPLHCAAMRVCALCTR